jgi:hypothetical protein
MATVNSREPHRHPDVYFVVGSVSRWKLKSVETLKKAKVSSEYET